MMALDPLDNLDEWPLKNIDKFIEECHRRGAEEINLTGSNTDPLLYKHLDRFTSKMKKFGFKIGIRTNGAAKNWTDILLFVN